MPGFFASIGAFFTHGAVGYATLLVFSVATITGSMFVLSTSQSNDVIFGTQRLANSALSTGGSADFKPETQVRTVIVNFEGGVATGLREAVTNLAGAIRAVSSNIINEALREDAARAAALAARPSAFGLSADSQLAAGAGALGVPVVPPQPTAVLQVPTTAPPPPAVPTSALPAPTAAPPTQAPPAPTAVLPTQAPPQPTAVPATPVPPTATPLPPAPTATPAPPQQQSQPDATSAPSQPTSAPDQPTAAAQSTTPPVVATVAALPTLVPVATLVPTPAAVPTLAPLAFDLGLSVGYQPFFTISGGMAGGAPVSRDVVLLNGSGNPMIAYLGTSLNGPPVATPQPTSTPIPAGGLWTDTTNGLMARILLTSGSGASQTVSTKYDGPLNFSNLLLTELREGQVHTMNVTIYIPPGVPNTLQASSQSAAFVFTLIQ